MVIFFKVRWKIKILSLIMDVLLNRSGPSGIDDNMKGIIGVFSRLSHFLSFDERIDQQIFSSNISFKLIQAVIPVLKPCTSRRFDIKSEK